MIKKIIQFMITFMISISIILGTVYAFEPVKLGLYRIFGASRYETSFACADALKEQLGIAYFDSFIIASGNNFPDALSGSYLSVKKQAPILLSNNKNTNQLSEYIQKNGSEKGIIYILGGKSVISRETEEQLEKITNFTIKRLGGKDRYDTNIQILLDAGMQDEVLVCNGNGFADSLSAAAVGKPILLVNKVLSEQQKQILDTVSTMYVLGGINAVDEKVEQQLQMYGKVVRLGGISRYETSKLVADTFFDDAKSISLAYAHNYPDGLCGGALAYFMNGPLLLVDQKNCEYASQFVKSDNVNTGVVFGGSSLIADDDVKKIMNTSEEVKLWQPSTYTITYELNGGMNNDENPSLYQFGDTVTLKSAIKENYDFQGWYLDKNFKNKIEEIKVGNRGNLILYARYSLKALNEVSEGMDNMIWSWWYYPQVVSTADKVYWGYASNEGYCGVAEYDINSGKTTKNALKKATKVDDHNGLGLTTLDDGRIICVYAGGHNSDNDMHIRISDKPNDITNFNTSVVLRSSGKTCYGQILNVHNTYYLFYRVNNDKWAYRTSHDCFSWSEEVIFVTSDMQYYCRFMPTTDENLIRCVMYSNPTSNDIRIRMGFLDVNSGNVLNADGKTILGKEKISYDQFSIIITPSDGSIQRMFDVAITDVDKPRILYTSFTNKKGANDSVYYLYDSGVTYKICEGGKPLWDPKYQLGAAFVDDNTIVVGRNDNNGDYIETYRIDESVYKEKVLDVQIDASTSRIARPIVDVNGKAILWHSGYYNLNVYTDFDTDAKLYLIDNK